MNSSQLLEEALTLPAPERAKMARQLLLSLDEELSEEDCEKAWEVEIQARAQGFAAGATEAVDWREAHDGIRRKANEAKP